MIEKLHEKINNITPIDGLEYNVNNNQCIIKYTNNYTPTEQELQQINTIIDQWPLERIKFLKLETLDTEWNNIISNGWTTPYGWKLGLDIQDVSLLMGVFILAKETHSSGLNSPIFIVDTNGISHEIAFADLTNLLMQYGQARSLLSQNYSNKKTLIEQASSIAELDNII